MFGIIIAIGLAVLSYALMPKPPAPPRQKAQDVQTPTIDAGRPIPVLFGRMRIKAPGVLTYGGQHNQEVKK